MPTRQKDRRDHQRERQRQSCRVPLHQRAFLTRFGRAELRGLRGENATAERPPDDRTGTVLRFGAPGWPVLAPARPEIRRPQLGGEPMRREPRLELELREFHLVFQFVQA